MACGITISCKRLRLQQLWRWRTACVLCSSEQGLLLSVRGAMSCAVGMWHPTVCRWCHTHSPWRVSRVRSGGGGGGARVSDTKQGPCQCDLWPGAPKGAKGLKVFLAITSWLCVFSCPEGANTLCPLGIYCQDIGFADTCFAPLRGERDEVQQLAPAQTQVGVGCCAPCHPILGRDARSYLALLVTHCMA